ncbi:Aft1 HRA domain-domain-containing protein [Kockovaella imperatae]|uniref:Aft1 HRA domain-domain-containing protein n=1 Tax=Kockovaella imperatae TaxID=4999 RepID=A0A1Y1U5U2_9TREE|nr:Aft1 HRA domain-domain-containing protein [Kockovaella imperatae]ORX33399.1 Aft1 HRA domain-domain-containing protein [Kockovaella imperatae]
MTAVAAAPAGLPRGPTPNPPRPSSSSSRNSNRETREKSSIPKPEPPPHEEEADHPQRPPIRPQVSKFDLEVNPFEQSFAGRSSHSSATSSHTTPPRGTDATSIKHNALPPLSALTSPAAANATQFPWLANQSLRTGPLSPAMLTGPQNANGSTQANGTGSKPEGGQTEGGAFDGSTFRTGFTPGTGSGFTPGYSSLVGNNFASSLPMPSPNTAAFLNMVTNETPTGEGGEGGGANGERSNASQPNGQPSGGPPNAIPPHMQQQHGLSHLQSEMPQETITPNTLSALTGVFNDMSRQQQQQQQQQQQGGPPQSNGHMFYPPMQHPVPHVDYAQQSANAASQAANGLFLLSQAHQELSKREEEGRSSSPDAPQPRTAKANGQAGTKRKSEPAAAPVKPPKKGRKASQAPPKIESTSPMSMGDLDEDQEAREARLGRPETEEEKRKNFLERNRQAALKCRQRKKAWLQELQTKVEQLTMENERLQQTIGGLHDEVGRLSSVLMQHRDCGLGIPTGYGRPIR